MSRQVQRASGGGIEVRPPKYGSERVVYLADGVLNELARHVSVLRGPTQADSWLFSTPDGKPMHQITVGYLWRKGD